MCNYMGAFYNADSRPMPRFQRAYPRIRPLLLMELRASQPARRIRMAPLKVCGARAHPEDLGRDGLGCRWSAWCYRVSGDKALDAALPNGEARNLAGCKLSAT